MSGDYAEAAEYITQYNSLKPYNADAFIILGYCSYRTGNYQLARDHFNRSLSLRNENPTALYNLARTCLKLGLTQEARSTYETLAKNHPAYGALPRLKSLFS